MGKGCRGLSLKEKRLSKRNCIKNSFDDSPAKQEYDRGN